MKKTFLTLISAFITLGMGYAQNMDGIMAQPTHVIGRTINAAGEISKELVSDFSYLEDGKLSRYEFPEYAITASFVYSDDFITRESIFHEGGHPVFSETNLYTYENGQVKTVSHLMSQMGISQYWVYSYYEDGRLERKDYREEDDDDYRIHWLYDYENEGKTVIEYNYTSWASQGLLLRKKTTQQYDDNFNLISEYTENYNESSELTSTTQTDYIYTFSGMLAKKIIQTLTDEEWVNSTIIQYAYDDAGRIAEQLDGIWNDENSEWDFTKRISFETSNDGETYIVSFYKKNADEWVWDVFNNQTILFGANLKAQQHMLSYMVYEDMNGYGNVNQLVFTLEYTPEPIYLDVEEKEDMVCTVHPNPTNGMVSITGIDLKQAEVFNMLGQCVAATQGEGERLTVDISSLPAGVYFINVTDEEGRKCVRKVIKE
jgi:hypothetical protein